MLVHLGCQRRLGWKVVPLSTRLAGSLRVQQLCRPHTLHPGDLMQLAHLARCGPVEILLQALPEQACCLVPLPQFLAGVVADAPGDDELVGPLRLQGKAPQAAELLIYVQRRATGPMEG